MSLRAVFFDWGGVIARTEYQAPREHLAERLNTTYEDLNRLVFDTESSRRASVGEITTDAHWDEVVRRLRLPASETKALREEFFAGDIVDRDLLAFVRSLRPAYKTGLISNAWPDLREVLVAQKAVDAFDALIISAEVGVMKPNARIYETALERLGITASEAVFIDDFPQNVEGARAVGMHSIVFREPAQALADLEEIMR